MDITKIVIEFTSEYPLVTVLWIGCGFFVANAIVVQFRAFNYKERSCQSMLRVRAVYGVSILVWLFVFVLGPIALLPGAFAFRRAMRNPSFFLKGFPFHKMFYRNMVIRRHLGQSPHG